MRSAQPSEHSVAVGAGFRHRLLHTPMFHDFAVFYPENIHHPRAPVLGMLRGMHMQKHQIAFSGGALNHALRLRIVFKILGEKVHERRFAIRHIRIVLNIFSADIAVCIAFDLMLEKYAFIKIRNNFLILLRLSKSCG